MVLLLAIVVPVAFSQSSHSALSSSPARPSEWFWGPTITVAQAFSGQFDDQVVVVEGQVGEQVDPIAWNIFLFSDSTGMTPADLENGLTTAQVPRDRMTMIYGKVKDDFGEWKIDAGLMLLAASFGS